MGAERIEALAPSGAAVVLVDVLSFTTCVELATDRGATVFPEAEAACASGREETTRHDEADLALASALDASSCVPVLAGGAYCASSRISSTRSG